MRGTTILIALILALPAQAEIPTSQAQIQLSFAPVAQQAAPAVVNIYTKRKVVERASPFFSDPFFQQFFGGGLSPQGLTRERIVSSLGSGVLVSPQGRIVTNYHVIKEAQDITVVLHDRRELAAEIELTDEQSDLALLKLTEKHDDLPFLPLRDSDELQVGDLVLAIGNPFGVGQTVTSGIVSATARAAKGVSDLGFFIQTDAAINPGNSGGALVDLQGRLVGVPSAIYTRSGGSNGIGFAIPANMVHALLAGDVKEGRLRRPWLGARYQDVTSDIAQSLKLPRVAGVLVSDIYDGSPAKQAGLKAGDVIVALAGKPTDDVQSLRFRIATEPLGERLPLTVQRDGRERELTLKLDFPPEEPARDERHLKGNHPMNGVQAANLNPSLAIEMGLEPDARGVIALNDAGALRRGDRVLSVNGENITSTKQLEKALRGAAGNGWRIGLQRGAQRLMLQVR